MAPLQFDLLGSRLILVYILGNGEADMMARFGAAKGRSLSEAYDSGLGRFGGRVEVPQGFVVWLDGTPM